MSLLSLTKIIIGVALLIVIIFTIRSVQKSGTGEFNGDVGWLMFLIAAESIVLPVYGYFLSI